MNKELIYKISILILLALNLLQLTSFLLMPKHRHHPGEDFKNEVVKMLDLDEQQKDSFFSSAEKHRESMTLLVNQQKELTRQYFNKASDSVLQKINLIETEKILITEVNFKEIQNILKPNQQDKFEAFKNKALQIIVQ